MDKPVIILGAGSLGKAALEIFQQNGVIVYCFLDDNKDLHQQEIDDIAIMGSTDDDGYLKYIGKKCEAFIAVDDQSYRKGLVTLLKERRKVMPVNAVHSSAHLATSAHIAHGNFINSGVTIGAHAKVGNHCLLHTNSVIDHEAELGDLVQIGAASVVNTGAKIEEGAFIGSGAIIVSGVTIGKNARVGAGSIVIADVKAGETVFGNPAQAIKS